MGGCSALGCRNSSAKGFLMRKFPKDPKRRQQWIANTKRGNWTPSEGACLCEVHFAPEMWEKVRQDGSRKLADHAIPTIFDYTHYTSSKKCRVMGHLTPQKQDTYQKKLNLQPEPSKVWVELHQVLQENEQDFIIVKVEKDEAIERVSNGVYNIDSGIILLDSQGGEARGKPKHVPVLSLPSSSQIDKTSLESQNKQYFIKNVNPIRKNKETLLIDNMKKLEAENEKLHSQVQNLQEQLKTNETEHQRTVIFSHILQVKLRKMCEEVHEVRWQHEEDINKCPLCATILTSSDMKQHCRHCGQIYCTGCITKVVLSGPNNRPSRVCDICHTMLGKISVPFINKPSSIR